MDTFTTNICNVQWWASELQYFQKWWYVVWFQGTLNTEAADGSEIVVPFVKLHGVTSQTSILIEIVTCIDVK